MDILANLPIKTKKPATRKKSSAARLSKEQWLKRSMRLLERRGPGAMTVEALTGNLGVTAGSFYWHFKSHGRFLDELTDRYLEDYTYRVGEKLQDLDLPPREMLREALQLIVSAGLGGMDLHFRSLAISYPRVAKKIRAMDEYRNRVITDLLSAMGYSGDELRMRVHIFVVVNSMEHAVTTALPPEDRLKLLDWRLKLLVD